MKKGFTLIELLVVIAIIGILVSILFKGVGKSNSPKNNKQICEEKAMYLSIRDLPAGCVQYFEPVQPTIEDKFKS